MQPEENQYFYAENNQQRGPVSASELLQLNLPPHTLVWHAGMTDWQPLQSLPELANAGARSAPLPLTPAPQAFDPAAPAPLTPLAYGGYGNAGTYPYNNAPAPTPGLAVASVVLGIVSMILCLWYIAIPSAILAIVFGFIARAQIKKGNRSGAGLALAGIILGFISIGLVLLFAIGIVAFVVAAHK